MHTAIVIIAGLALLGAGLVIARIIGRGPMREGPTMINAAKAFIPVWLVLALINFWFGVSYAGHAVAAEVPFLAIVFAVPAAVAYFVWRHFAGAAPVK